MGLRAIDQGTSLGGTLLVQPYQVSTMSFPVSVDFVLPYAPEYFGRSLYLQTIMTDPEASRGASFSRGLRLSLGH